MCIGHPWIIRQCNDIAQHLLDWSVLWLSGFWDQPEPLSLNPDEQTLLDKVALRYRYASVFCEECSSSKGMAAFTDDPGPKRAL